MDAIGINQVFFMQIFGADADFRPDLECQEVFLDRESGELVYTTSAPFMAEMQMGKSVVEELLEDTAQVKAHPEQYLKIESMGHGEHHSVMQDFLCSKWTTDQARFDNASNVYYSRKSIGCWIKNVGDQGAVDAYYAFNESEKIRLAEEFLRNNGVVDFVWI